MVGRPGTSMARLRHDPAQVLDALHSLLAFVVCYERIMFIYCLLKLTCFVGIVCQIRYFIIYFKNQKEVCVVNSHKLYAPIVSWVMGHRLTVIALLSLLYITFSYLLFLFYLLLYFIHYTVLTLNIFTYTLLKIIILKLTL